MDDTKLRFGVGVLVLSAIGVGVILTFLFGAFPAALARTYEITVDIDSAAGISNNTPVLRDGVRIGRVSKIQLRPEGGVQLTLAIDANRQLTRAYVPKVGSTSLVTGDAKLEFQKDLSVALENLDGQAPVGQQPVPTNQQWDPPEKELLATFYADGDYIKSSDASADPMAAIASLEDDMRRTLTSVQDAGLALKNAGESFNKLTDSVRGIVSDNDNNFRDIAGNANKALVEFQTAMFRINEITGDPELRARLIESLDSLPRVLNEAELALSNTKTTMKKFEEVGEAAETAMINAGQTLGTFERTLGNIEQITRPFGERSNELADQVFGSLASLDATLQQLGQFGDMVNSSDGSLRRFIEDDELYFQVKRTLGNIEQATMRIRPILDDVRIFTDKVARDPSQLGVKGALSARPGGLGLK
jgi:phospholipid/cholesterol/gamma-HCH transport system substrate-binding protein